MIVVVITRWLMVIKLEKETAFLIQPRDGENNAILSRKSPFSTEEFGKS